VILQSATLKPKQKLTLWTQGETDYHPACFTSDVNQTLRKSQHSGMLQLALRHRKSSSHRSAVDAQRTEEKCLKFQGESPPYILNRKCDGPQSRARRYGENKKLLVLTGSRNTIPKYPVLVLSFYTMKRDIHY